MPSRQVNEVTLQLINQFEKDVLTVYAHDHDSSILTVGRGHKVRQQDNLKLGDTITQEADDAFFEQDITNAQRIVDAHVKAKLNDNQYGACVSLAFNAGSEPFVMHFGALLNSYRFEEAAEDFLNWDHARVDGVLIVVEGLLNRRKAERDLFLTPVEAANA